MVYAMTAKSQSYDQVVYLLQGGGALGAYQVGVCEAFLDFGCPPDWLIGTSIGAINAAIIAGNKPKLRIKKLKEFWGMIELKVPFFPINENHIFLQKVQNYYIAQLITFFGLPGFFTPKLFNPWHLLSNTPDQLSYYDTKALRATLEKVIDFELINKKQTRLTLGVVHVNSGKDVRFDNHYQTINVDHVMASCALPPGFPAINIKGEYYWDGGVSSNTPLSVILKEKNPKKLLCVLVDLFSFPDHNPTSIMEVHKFKKEFEYASRHQEILNQFLEVHYLQETINDLAKMQKNNKSLEFALKKIAHIGHPSSLNIAHFHYKDQASDLSSSDFNFSPHELKKHWQSGLQAAQKALEKSSWMQSEVGESGVIIQEF
jgi:NTE family protein